VQSLAKRLKDMEALIEEVGEHSYTSLPTMPAFCMQAGSGSYGRVELGCGLINKQSAMLRKPDLCSVLTRDGSQSCLRHHTVELADP
jgi:hypothetical protein